MMLKKKFDTSNYEVDRSWTTGKKQNIYRIDEIWITKKNYEKFVAIIRKAYSYLMDDSNSNEKAKGTKKCVIKRILKILFI